MSATIVYNPAAGSGLILQADERGYSPDRGSFIIRRWRGPTASALAYESTLRAASIEYTNDNRSPFATITAKIGYDDTTSPGTPEVPVNLWERQANRVEKTIYEFPTVAALGVDYIAKIRESVQGNYTDAQFIEALGEIPLVGSGGTGSPERDGVATEVFELIRKGVDSFPIWQPVVVQTQIVSSSYPRSAVTDNVGKILSKAQMIGLEEAPEGVLDDKTVPDGLASIARYGYYKNEPVITQQANNRWHIVTQWEAGFWSTFLYENAT